MLSRYTVRAKAGGAQSSNDNSGRKAQSIGSSLRRYGEAALKEDIRSILKTWAALINNSSVILLSVPKTMRPTLFEEENSTILDKRDPRIRFVPFMTDKPTFETVKEIHRICSTVYFKEISESDTGADDLAGLSVQLSPIREEAEAKREKIASHKAAQPQLISCPESVLLFDMMKRIANSTNVNIDAVLTELVSWFDSTRMRYDMGVEPTAEAGSHTPLSPPALSHELSLGLTIEDVLNLPGSLDDLWTALHWASDIGIPEIITKLLMEGSDPTSRDVRGRTPFFLCKSKDSRDAFRRFRATAERQWNWSDAGVPDALTPEMETAQKEKEKEKKKRAKAKKAEQKEQESVEAARAAEVVATIKSDVPGAKPRAAAAGNCAQCNTSLFRKAVVNVGDASCCSTDCAAKFKRQLAADAAMARFKSKP